MARGRALIKYGKTAGLLAVLATLAIQAVGMTRSGVPSPGAPGVGRQPSDGAAQGHPGTVIRAVARERGGAVPGARLTLSSRGSEGTNLRVRWVQVEGPPATPDDPTGPETELTVPEGPGVLGFLLIVSNEAGSDTDRLSIPIESRAPSASATLRADAGADQFGQAGGQVTLNGIASAPRAGIGYRWIQVGGPPVRMQMSDRYIHTFVPPCPGTYRYALVVAQGGQISEPDFVTVSVGAPAVSARAGTPSALPPEPVSEFARASLATLREPDETAGALASTFEAIAARVDLYTSYDDLYSELSRRLEAILPEDPARRAMWGDRLFQPLTVRLIEEMRTVDLDLRLPEGRAAGLSQAQRAHFAELFRAMAEGFRPQAAH